MLSMLSKSRNVQFRRIAVAVSAGVALAFFLADKPVFAEGPLKDEPVKDESIKDGPIKVGFGISTSGAAAQEGKQVLIALQLWRDDVNARGGLLGRPVDLVYYDDESNPFKELEIYRKLTNVDKVDLLVGPYGNLAAAVVMRTLVQSNRGTVSILGAGANRVFSYGKYFAMVPAGPDGVRGISKEFFDFAAQQQPKPQSVAIVAADAEYPKAIADGARANAAALGLTIAYDKSYQPDTSDFNTILGEVQTANADIVFVSASSSDTVGLIKVARDIGLAPKLFGGSLPGLQPTAVKAQLGPLLNGILVIENFVPAFNFPGVADLLKRYRGMAVSAQTDPLGYELVPFGYAAGQVLAQAVEQTRSLNPDELTEYIGNHLFKTVVGDVEFGTNGEWKKGRTVLTQFQHVSADNVEQFARPEVQPIVWPPQYKTGDILYPYVDAKK
jgi:branched-chain amino acid transport system substrate-binding protein